MWLEISRNSMAPQQIKTCDNDGHYIGCKARFFQASMIRVVYIYIFYFFYCRCQWLHPQKNVHTCYSEESRYMCHNSGRRDLNPIRENLFKPNLETYPQGLSEVVWEFIQIWPQGLLWAFEICSFKFAQKLIESIPNMFFRIGSMNYR